MKKIPIAVALFGFLASMAAGQAAQAPAALSDLLKEYPACVFNDNFNRCADGEYPDGWQAMVNVGQPFAQVEQGAFRILTGGNVHLIQPLVLDDFLLKYLVRGEKHQPNKLFCHMPCFRIGPDPTGYMVFHQYGRYAARHASLWKVKEGDPSFRCSIHNMAYGAFEDTNLVSIFNPPLEKLSEQAGRDAYDTTDWHDMVVVARSNRFSVFQDGVLTGMFEDKINRYARGRIGFTMAGSQATQPGAMFLDDVQVYVKQPVREEVVTDLKNIEINWKYNRVANAMPATYDVQVARYGNGYVLRGSVRNGGCIPGLPHVMLNPYVKLDTVDGRRSIKLYLFRGTVGRVDIDGAIAPPPFGPTDTSGPQQAQRYFDFDPGKHRISVGYEYYVGSVGATLAGPCEVVVDAASKKVVHEGLPLKDGVVLTMSSPPVKKVLERVNPTNSFYAGFKEFLADNHFFVEGEKIAFRADLLQTRLNPSLSYRAEFRVKDAFKDRVLKEFSRDFAPDRSEAGAQRAAAGLNPLWSGWEDLGKLDPGVYHLEITARDSNGMLLGSVIKAFSVMSAKIDKELTPAERSRLPLMTGENHYPMQPVYQGDAYHYSCLAGADASIPDVAELQYALNKRVLLVSVDITTPAAAEKMRPYFRYAVGLVSPKLPADLEKILYAARIYDSDFDGFAGDFLKSPFYKPLPDKDISGLMTAKPDFIKLRDAVKRTYWKNFTAYLVEARGRAVKQARECMRAVNPEFKFFTYGFPYPINIDYMTPYGGINSAGHDLKNTGWERDWVRLELYYDECRYAPERDWACWAMIKMVQPAVLYLPDDEGYVSCIEDGNNSAGWPPYGMMKVAPGFFKKGLVMHALCPVYFRDKRCHWAWDNQFHIGSIQPPQLNELVQGFKLINRHAPDKPAQTVAYVYAQEWIAKHPEVLDPEMYPYNPADESIVFAYEEGCRAGVPNGFFVDASDLKNLDRSLANTIVLPPLKYADDKALQAIRKLHAQGINLVAFEDVTGLEDLFGVKRLAAPAECASVQVADNAPAKALLYDAAETNVLHSGNLKTVAYGLAGGQAILECADAAGKTVGPALVLNRDPKAATLLWTLEPTDIARSRNHVGARMRGECASELVRIAMGRGLKAIADTPVTTTEGNLLAYWQKDGKLCVMVYENAFPYPSKPIHPLVKIRMKGIGKYRIESEKTYTPGIHTKNEVTFSFDLAAEELAVFTLEK